MDIVIVSQYLRDIENFANNNSRFIYLAKLLAENPENKVEIVTSDFCHAAKKHFNKIDSLPGIKLTVLHESGYPKNVCLTRFASHRELAKNIKNYLNSRAIPDVCYCAIPSLDVADEVSKYCARNNVRFIADVQDLWPEAFKMVFHVPVVSDLIFAPMQRQADRIYKNADNIIAVSKTYTDRAMRVNSKCKNPAVVYLGTEKDSFDRYAQNMPENIEQESVYGKLTDELLTNTNDIIRIAYCGTLGHSYDITCVIEAIRCLDAKDKEKINFIVMGDGPKKDEFEKKAKGLPITFTGRLSYPEMVWLLIRCDIAVNPISKGAAQSIINKHMDYAMAGLPVINTQECVEYRNLVGEYNAGINCECENFHQISEAIQLLSNDSEMRSNMGKNNRRLGEEKFDRKRTYAEICNIIQSL